MRGRDTPAARISLRSGDTEAFVIVDEESGAVHGTSERERAFSERSVCSEVIVGQVRLDDAVEHGDERGAFRMKSLRHLREPDPADVGERVEELPQWMP